MCDFVAIPLQLGKVTLVSPEDAEWVKKHKWHAHKSAYTWYACRKVGKRGQQKRIWLHNAIMKPKPGQEVHHKDGNSLDNRRPKLIVCTKQENLSYRKGGQQNVSPSCST